MSREESVHNKRVQMVVWKGPQSQFPAAFFALQPMNKTAATSKFHWHRKKVKLVAFTFQSPEFLVNLGGVPKNNSKPDQNLYTKSCAPGPHRRKVSRKRGRPGSVHGPIFCGHRCHRSLIWKWKGRPRIQLAM